MVPPLPSNCADDNPLQGLPVLLVSDHDASRDMLTLLLCAYGAQLRVTTSAQQCLAAFEAQGAGVLVVDLTSPVDDAIWLMEQIRALNPTLPALALSPQTSADHRERCLRAGYRQHALKPVRPHHLVRLLTELTSSPTPWPPPTST